MTIHDDYLAQLNHFELKNATGDALNGLNAQKHCVVSMTPGDGTRYIFMIIEMPEDEQPNWGGKYAVAGNVIQTYPWTPGYTDVSYVLEKWTDNDRTAVVLAYFLNALTDLIALSMTEVTYRNNALSGVKS